MRLLGFVLLLAGFLWLTYDALSAFPARNYADTANVVDFFKRGWIEPMPPQVTSGVIWGLYNDEKSQYRLLLLPACLMIGGSLMLRAKRKARIIVRRAAAGAANARGAASKNTETYSGQRLKRLRGLGYALLMVGALWLVHDALAGVARDHFRATDQITKRILTFRDGVPRSAVFEPLKDLPNRLKARYRLLLLPGCFILVGGLMIAVQRRPVIVIERSADDKKDFARVADIRARLEESRGYVGRPPQKTDAYRKGLLGFARRAVGATAFFRSRKSEEHADADTP